MARSLALAACAAALTLIPAARAQSLTGLFNYWHPARADNLASSLPTYITTPPVGYSLAGGVGSVYAPSPPQGFVGLKQLHRWFSPSRGDHFTTSSAAWQGSSGQTRSPDYTWVTSEGWVFNTPLAGTRALSLLYSPSRGDNYLTADLYETVYLNTGPDYGSGGTQGYVVNNELGATNYISAFDQGTLAYGSGAWGSRKLLVLMLQYTDFPSRHSNAQMQSLFFGPAFPNVNGFFGATSAGNWQWTNAGVLGPYTVVDEPETTGDESKWRDTWDSTYAPFLYLSIQTSNQVNWLWAASGGGPFSLVEALSGGAGVWEDFQLIDVNGGNLLSNDFIALKTYQRTYWRTSGTSVFADSPTYSTTADQFSVIKVSGSVGSQINSGDAVQLKSRSTGKYLRADGGGGGAVLADLTTPDATATFYFFKNAPSVAHLTREGLRQAGNAGFNFAPLDTNGDGHITNTELQIYQVGSGPADPPGTALATDGAATRGTQNYQPPSSTKIVDSAYVASGGEDQSFMTICHELTHCLGAFYEMYGAYGMNQNLTTMGATIYNQIDNRSTYLHDCWTRMRFGWLYPRIFSLADAGSVATLQSFDSGSDNADKRPILLFDPLRFNLATGEGEYFMLEYRNPNLSSTSYDTNASYQGVVIWQCSTGPDGANHIITAAAGACCDTSGNCFTFPEWNCIAPRVFKGEGTVCSPTNTCLTTPPVKLIDGSINYLGSPDMRRGWGPLWTATTTPTTGIVPIYLDGSNAPFHLYVGPTTSTSSSVNVQWSYSTALPPRIESVSRLIARRTTYIDVTGLLGVKPYTMEIIPQFSGPSRTTISTTNVTPFSCRVHASTFLPTGVWRLVARQSPWDSNEVQIRISPRSDWNEDGVLTVQDIFDMLNDWFAGHADYNLFGGLSVQDIFDFLNDWFDGV
jgi:M6 family metalloprotease-like protein